MANVKIGDAVRYSNPGWANAFGRTGTVVEVASSFIVMRLDKPLTEGSFPKVIRLVANHGNYEVLNYPESEEG